MNKICTSIEQSQKLIELGISYDTADMIWATIYDENHMVSDYRSDVIPCRLYSGNAIPAWSLSALLNLMPETIVPDNDSHQVYQMDVYNYDGWRICEYVGEIDRDSLVGFEKEWFIDAAFEMVCWLKENGKI